MIESYESIMADPIRMMKLSNPEESRALFKIRCRVKGAPKEIFTTIHKMNELSKLYEENARLTAEIEQLKAKKEKQ